MPSSWIPTSTSTTTEPTTTSIPDDQMKGYPYTYWEYSAGGAKIACETSILSTEAVGVSPEPVATKCHGSSTTVVPGVSYVTTATVISASPVIAGNWAHATSETSDLPATTTVSEREVLASSIYAALSSVCSNTDNQHAVTTHGPTTSWNDDLNSMTTVTVSKTLTACATDKVKVINVNYLPDGDGSSSTQSGDLEISVVDSWFDEKNLKTWMWTIAFAYAQSAMNTTIYPKYRWRSGETGNEAVYELAQHYAPSQVELSYRGSFDVGADVETLHTMMHFHMSEKEVIACQTSAEMVNMFADLAAIVVPEIGPELRMAADAATPALEFACMNDLDSNAN